MTAPLYDALRRYAAQNPLRFHMPGHKGKPLLVPELSGLSALDVTELPTTGNLYEAGEPFDSAQRLWAEAFGFESCQFLTGGSTMGIHTGLSLLCRPGERVLMDRGCHRAAFNAMALLDLEPVYLPRPWLEEENLTGPISPENVENFLNAYPDIRTVCITSPTYSGVLSNIGAIARIVHAHGGKLFVDGAHGAHLPFLGLAPFWGADVVVVSAHKTLPVMGQTALLFTNGVDIRQVRRMASVYGSSSPSYPMLASLDTARQWLQEDGSAEYARTAVRVAGLRRTFPSLRPTPALPLDPTRFVLNGTNGFTLARKLEAQGVWPEMEDGGHVVFICTAMDSDEDFTRFQEVLDTLRSELGSCPPLPPPPLPERACSIRDALFAPSRTLPLEACENQIAACQIAPYPPGVPVVAPGEVISKKELVYLREIGYNSCGIDIVVSG